MMYSNSGYRNTDIFFTPVITKGNKLLLKGSLGEVLLRNLDDIMEGRQRERLYLIFCYQTHSVLHRPL